MKSYKIGFTDSGVGSLIFARDFIVNSTKKLRELGGLYGVKFEFLQCGDNKNMPYSSKNREDVKNFINKSLDYLEEKGVNLSIIACNTACINNNDFSRNMKIMTIINESAKLLEEVLTENNDKSVLIMATNATINSGDYQKLLSGFNIKTFSSSLMAEAIEKEILTENRIKEIINEEMQKLGNIDEIQTIALFCTHYPFYTKYLKEYFPQKRIITQGSLLSTVILEKIQTDLEYKIQYNFTNKDIQDIALNNLFLIGCKNLYGY